MFKYIIYNLSTFKWVTFEKYLSESEKLPYFFLHFLSSVQLKCGSVSKSLMKVILVLTRQLETVIKHPYIL